MRRWAADLVRSTVLLLALWSVYAATFWVTDTGAIATEFRQAMHNPYGDETEGVLQKHVPIEATADVVAEQLRANRFDCSSSMLSGSTVMICHRAGAGGKLFFLCEREWRAEFLFDGAVAGQAKLTKMRAEARGEC